MAKATPESMGVDATTGTELPPQPEPGIPGTGGGSTTTNEPATITPTITPEDGGTSEDKPPRKYEEPGISPEQPPPEGGKRATSIDDICTIDLSKILNVSYVVGDLSRSPAQKVTIRNKSLTNMIFVQLFLPSFLETENKVTEYLIYPQRTQEVMVGIREVGALSAVFQGLYTYSEIIDVYIDVLNVTGPVLVTDN